MHTVYPVTTFDSTITYPSVLYPAPQYTTGTAQQQADGYAFFTSKAMLMLPDWSNGAGRPGILACHGRNQNVQLSFGSDPTWGDYHRALANAGFVILAVDLGFNSWSNNLTLRVLDQAYTYLTGITGGTKVGLMGTSMGTITALQWLRRHPTLVAGTWLSSTFVDLDTVRGTAGWTTPYSMQPGDPNAGIAYPVPGDATFIANQASLSGAYKVTNDAQWSANVISQGHTPARYPELWRGNRIKFVHSVYDEGVPYQSMLWLASQINDPLVSTRLIWATTSKHEPRSHLAGGTTDAATIAAGGLPRSEMRDFFYEVL
jgi:pimeloyl-ACP methyl ester carboxylesterase